MVMLMSFDSLHGILRSLYEQMMPLCKEMTGVATGIAGIGALLYIAYRIWQSMARAEPIDVFPLLRPFAIGICIFFFQPLVIGGIQGILSPVVQGTHRIMEGRIFDMQNFQHQKDELEKENMLRDPTQAYMVSDEEFDRQIGELGWSSEDIEILEEMYARRTWFNLESIVTTALRKVLEFFFQAASLVIDCLRTFYLIVLSIFGPIAFGISVFDGFQNTLTH